MYIQETLDPDDDDGTMVESLDSLKEAVVGHRIVKAEKTENLPSTGKPSDDWYHSGLLLTLDDGRQVVMRNTDDCCAYTELDGFFMDPNAVDHIITGVVTSEGFTKWHIYAAYNDIYKNLMTLDVSWSVGNAFYYVYGFRIDVIPAPTNKEITMSETNNVGEQNAADPAENHKTPGGQPGDNAPVEPKTETTVETPGGTTVTESPAE